MRNPLWLPLLTLLLTLGLQAQTGQPRSDQLVGYWVSSSGTEVTLSYTGDPSTFAIQAGSKEYTAHWTSDTTFFYDAQDERVKGEYLRGQDQVVVRGNGWSATWRRRN